MGFRGSQVRILSSRWRRTTTDETRHHTRDGGFLVVCTLLGATCATVMRSSQTRRLIAPGKAPLSLSLGPLLVAAEATDPGKRRSAARAASAAARGSRRSIEVLVYVFKRLLINNLCVYISTRMLSRYSARLEVIHTASHRCDHENVMCA